MTLDDFVPRDKDGKVNKKYLDPSDALLQAVDKQIKDFQISNGKISTEGCFNMRNLVYKMCSEEHKPTKDQLFNERIGHFG